MLPAIAKALKVSIDELLGVGPVRKKIARPSNTHLERRLQEIDKLDGKTKRQVMQLLDTFIAHQKLRQKIDKQPA